MTVSVPAYRELARLWEGVPHKLDETCVVKQGGVSAERAVTEAICCSVCGCKARVCAQLTVAGRDSALDEIAAQLNPLGPACVRCPSPCHAVYAHLW